MSTIIGFILLGFFEFQPALANPAVQLPTRRPEFRVPARLRSRVNFWIDVFTKYGKDQVLIHHREFPQAVFDVLDFREEASRMNPVQLEKFRDKAVRKRIAEIREGFRSLARGEPAKPGLEQSLESEMKKVVGGVERYKRIINEDLIRAQTGIREKYADAIIRSGRYLPIIERIFVKEYGLPIELTRLPFIESSFDYQAYSSAGAAGIWQFMPRTARIHRLTVNSFVDERRDPIEATRAAAQYLMGAYNDIGSWPLSITSYNHGVVGVLRKVRKLGTTDISSVVEHPTNQVFGFASNNFFPEFLAALEVYDQYELYFPGIKVEEPLRITEVRLGKALPASAVAKALGAETDALRKVNYALSDPIWKGRFPIPKGYSLKIPQDFGLRLVNLKTLEIEQEEIIPAASLVHGGIVYTVRSGDSLTGIAKKYRVSVSQLKELNALEGNVLKVGQKLRVRQDETSKPQTVLREPEPVPSEPAVSSLESYTVKPGDTLSSIAQDLSTTVTRLRELNHLRSARLRVGQLLKIEKREATTSEVQTSTVTGSPAADRKYVVKRGDSLWTIAKKHGVSIEKLRDINKLQNNALKIGQTITIP